MLLATVVAGAQTPPVRPPITGLAHVAFYVHDVALSRSYYRDLLGLTETVSADRPGLRFAVNERQSIDVLPEAEPGSDRLAHIALETADADGLRRYLWSRGVAVPGTVSVTSDGERGFAVSDPDGHTVEFVERAVAHRPQGRGDERAVPLSRVMRHAGILVGDLDAALRYYHDVLGLQETWRGSRDGATLDWVNLRLPESEDYLEFMLYATLPAHSARGSQHHVCLVVPDIERAAASVRARVPALGYTRPVETRVGINRKRQLNLFDPDGTRAELMEPQTVDGQVVPSATAKPPRAGLGGKNRP